MKRRTILIALLVIISVWLICAAAAPTLTLYSPAAYQVFQREAGVGSIVVAGEITNRIPGAVYVIEARWGDAAPWETIDNNVSRVFEGVMPNKTQGQASFQARIQGIDTSVVTVQYVGIGDVFVIAGQSNAMGYGVSYQVYTHPTLKAGLFGNNYTWRELKDPVDLATGTVDAINSDGALPRGSYWPLLATYIMASQNVPVAFIPVPRGDTSITQWQPSHTNRYDRTTLYGAMLNRVLTVGDVKAVLWHQGERDMRLKTAGEVYARLLETLADNIWQDLGVPLVPVKVQSLALTYTTGTAQWQINQGIEAAAERNDHILTPVDLSDLPSEDGVAHLRLNATLAEAARRWWAVFDTTLYP